MAAQAILPGDTAALPADTDAHSADESVRHAAAPPGGIHAGQMFDTEEQALAHIRAVCMRDGYLCRKGRRCMRAPRGEPAAADGGGSG
jgi:hypothetical protein